MSPGDQRPGSGEDDQGPHKFFVDIGSCKIICSPEVRENLYLAIDKF